MIQPLFAFADLGFFLLRLFLGILIIESFWRNARTLKQGKDFSFGKWLPSVFAGILGILLIFGAFVQLAGLLTILLVAVSRSVRDALFLSDRALGLFALALLTLVFVGGGILSADQFFGFILY